VAASGKRAAIFIPHWPHASLALLCGTVYAGWYLFALPANDVGRYLSDLFLLIASSVAALACVRVGRAAGATGVPWLWFGASSACWFLGTLLWIAFDTSRLDRPDNASPGSLALALFYVCLFVGVLSIIRTSDLRYPIREMVIDSLITIVVLAAVVFEGLLEPAIDSSNHELTAFAMASSWAIALLLLLAVAVLGLILSTRGSNRFVLILLLGGLITFTAADMGYIWAMVHNSYEVPSPIDLCWQLGFGLLALAATATQGAREPRGVAVVASRTYLRGRLLLSVLGVLSITALAVYAATQPRDNPVNFAVLACGVLLAMRLGLASRNSDRLLVRTRERDRLAAVVEMSAAVAGTLDKEQVLVHLALVSAQAVGCDRAAVTVVGPDGTIEQRVTHGVTDRERSLLDDINAPQTVLDTTWRWSAAGRTMAVRWEEVQGIPPAAAAVFQEIGKRQSLITPLLAQDEVLGFVELWRAGENERFDTEDAIAAAAIARQGGLALRNARLHADAQLNGEERAMLLRVSQAATSTLELRPMLAEVAKTTLGIANAEACWIEMWHPRSREFEVVAAETAPDWPGTDPPGKKYPFDQRNSVKMVFEQATPMIFNVPDPSFTELELKEFVDNNVQSTLFVPLITGDVCVGELRLFSRQRDVFGPGELRIAQDIGSQVSLAIQNARLMEETQRRVEEQALRLRISQTSTSTLDLQTVLDEIAVAVLSIPAVESCGIELWHADTDELEIRAEAAVPDWMCSGDSGRRFPVGYWASDRTALRSKTPLSFNLDDQTLSTRERSDMTNAGVASMVRFPVLIGTDCLGLLNVYSRRLHAFGPDEVRLGQDIANQTALAIHNAQLLEDAQRLAMEQSGLLRVSQAIISNNELDAVLKDVARASHGVAGAECCEIELWYPETNETLIMAQEFVDSWDEPDHSGHRLSLTDWPTTKQVIVEQQPLTFDSDASFLTPVERVIYSNGGTRSVLLVPLLIDNGCVGLINFYSRQTAAFPARTVRIGQELASQAALAIERARLHEALKERALTDGLTGLLNHRSILESLDAELSRSRRDGNPLAVLMIDLDGFKQVNDQHGHLAGDDVLRSVASILKTTVRDIDQVGRYGGDEFLLLLHSTALPEAQEVAVRIWRRIEREVHPKFAVNTPIRLSIGIASAPEHGATRQDLIATADAAMYMAKQRMMPATDELIAREHH
jgi:diguanylate cyclase (GGDEF)-like protein